MNNTDVIERITLHPDAGLVDSLGAHYTLESAIADLIDNSIDARATQVSVRLLTRKDRLVQVEILDDGDGMDAEGINAAMTVGHRRHYGKHDLGYFGMGLKAASFGLCDVLTVWSSSKHPAKPVGRRIRRVDYSKDFGCEVLSTDVAIEQGEHRAAVIGSTKGTSIILSKLRNTYRGRSPEEARQWLSARNDALRTHLGVTFHRLLADKRIQIDVLTDELDDALPQTGTPVTPINPIGYAPWRPDYPKVIEVKARGARARLNCHIWPPKSDVTGFRIGAKSGEQLQGFYIYRKDRLLQVGGWSDMATATPSRQLARVVVEDADAFGSFWVMNPEKTELHAQPLLYDAVDKASADDGTTFIEYLQDAESVYTDARKRQRRRKPVIEPDQGFAPEIRKKIATELRFTNDAVDIKWRRMPQGEFFDVELATKTLWLNDRYRRLFAPQKGSKNDAPVLKALMFLLTHQVFEGQHFGPKDKDEIALWKSVLGTAVLIEQRMRGEGQG